MRGRRQSVGDEPENELCCTCEYYEYDNWYPGERICTNNHSPQCGLTVDKYDRCDWWERRRE